MKIFMTGGTGFIGTNLAARLAREGHRLTILSRVVREDRSPPHGVNYVQGNPTEKGAWQMQVPEHEVIINLAGASIFTRWTREAKKRIRESRILTTENLVEALSARKGGEPLFLSTSAVGYYGFHEEQELDEGSPPGEDFLASLTREWEKTALKAEAFGARVVLLRFGIVLGRRGGALQKMIPIFRKGLGSPIGDGKQWFPWIHEKDLADIYLYTLGRKDLSGPLNCTAPNPVRNRELTKALGKALGKPTLMPAVPAFVMKIVMGEFGSSLVKGQKVFPKRLLEGGFPFAFPELKGALDDLIP